MCTTKNKILNTSISVNYNNGIACRVCFNKDICLDDLKRQIHTKLILLSNYLNMSIRAKVNTTQSGSGPSMYIILNEF
jgi:hypothetical protein